MSVDLSKTRPKTPASLSTALTVAFRYRHEVLFGSCQKVDRQGLAMEVDKALVEGARVELKFTLPERSKGLYARGFVESICPPLHAEGRWYAIVRFQENSLEEAHCIEQFIKGFRGTEQRSYDADQPNVGTTLNETLPPLTRASLEDRLQEIQKRRELPRQWQGSCSGEETLRARPEPKTAEYGVIRTRASDNSSPRVQWEPQEDLKTQAYPPPKPSSRTCQKPTHPAGHRPISRQQIQSLRKTAAVDIETYEQIKRVEAHEIVQAPYASLTHSQAGPRAWIEFTRLEHLLYAFEHQLRKGGLMLRFLTLLAANSPIDVCISFQGRDCWLSGRIAWSQKDGTTGLIFDDFTPAQLRDLEAHLGLR